MSALVTFRSNATGALSPTPAQRVQAAEQTAANALARATALNRLKTGASATTASTAKAGTTEATTSTTAETRVVSSELDKDAFLELLVLELQNQDPLEPVDNADMLAQLAQFSSLEQMEQLNDTMEALGGNINQLNFISAGSLLGRSIDGYDANGKEVSGVVDGIYMDGDMVYLRVGEDVVPMAYVVTVENTATETDTTT